MKEMQTKVKAGSKNMQNYNASIDKMVNLPSPPAIVQQLAAKINSEDASSKEVARIIETDQGFTARVLRLVNSPFYGFARKVVSVGDAITMLGLNAINQLLLTASLVSSFKADKKIIDLNSFWKHSFAVGVFAKHLLKEGNRDQKAEVFLCGVMHDVGRLIYLQIEPKKFVEFYMENDSVINVDGEDMFFGINHQKIGALLARKWNFPESVSAVIANHHTPDPDSRYGKVVSAVHIADMITHSMRIGESGKYYISDFNEQAWHKLDLSMEEFEEILKRSLVEIDSLESMIASLG